ncbi:hypothetical protein [Salimicrobium flavidum]|uniref:Uncharacterized protein YpmB n=1 Tax=Salimicrobium flavidum TaxID=570947 RepID=A0A1N7IJD2_9BACI|nr:hypothetical protein [Salimicrobium flavidum]SIS37203.1 Uncharacterized protein YpmB [Salimicrobium flavidum]
MKPNYLWWIAGSLAGILLIAALLYGIFYNILDDRRTEGIPSSIDTVESQVEGVEVNESYTFNGDFPVHILYASGEEQSMIYYVNPDEGTIVDRVPQNDQMEKADIRETWNNNCGQCKFTHIQPAYKNDRPLWEITYTDSKGRYGLAYYHMSNGEEYQRFSFKNNE